MVMVIHRPDVSATEEEIKSGKIIKDAADLIIAKHRNGELGRVNLRFRGDQVRHGHPPPGFLPEDPMEGRESRHEDEDGLSDEDFAELAAPSDEFDEDAMPPDPDEEA